MRICVCIKQTPDSASVYIDPISNQIDVERFVQVLNPADASAIEAAVRLKERYGGTITALTLGAEDAEGALRAALAIGADTALRISSSDGDDWDPLVVAACLAACIRQFKDTQDLVLCGESSSDWASSTVGPALACYLDLPQVTNVIHLTAPEDGQALHLTRRLERGYREVLIAELPLLLTVSSDLNEPRYPSLPAHLAALRAPITIIDVISLQLDALPETVTAILELHTPRPRPRRLVAPDSKHSAYQRIGEIINAGATSRTISLVEGTPEELAQALVRFLKKRGYV